MKDQFVMAEVLMQELPTYLQDKWNEGYAPVKVFDAVTRQRSIPYNDHNIVWDEQVCQVLMQLRPDYGDLAVHDD